MHFTVYCDAYFTNQYDATCFIALEEKGVAYSTSRALLREGQGFPPGMHARTPIMLVPALQHGDYWLTESLAIAEYIEDVLPAPAYPRLLPADVRERARARQLMSWLRCELRQMRHERPWYTTVYPTDLAPLTASAMREAQDLIDVTVRMTARGELAGWNIAHADLALTLMRIDRPDMVLPEEVHALLAANRARPSVKAYVEHARPPNTPP